MAHIFYIDPLEKLNFRKDSTLMMALSFQSVGIESFLMFEKDFYVVNDQDISLALYSFSGEFEESNCYLSDFKLEAKTNYKVGQADIVHMRIDPPYDTRYQRYLWMLDFLRTRTDCQVINDPLKIMKYNEKLVAMVDGSVSHESYIGSSLNGFEKFVSRMSVKGFDSLILKPLDLYSGIGVEKVSIADPDLITKFNKKINDFAGAIVCQPFIKEVYEGEYRSIYFDGKEIGTIIKKPNKGEFLANIAQGAAFEKTELPKQLKYDCDQMAERLFKDDVRLVAFDVLGGAINEVNITCPGLLVEVSYAYEKNLCYIIADKFKS